MPLCNGGERPLYSVARTATVPNNPSSGKRLESCGTTSPLLQVGVVDCYLLVQHTAAIKNTDGLGVFLGNYIDILE